MHALIKQPWLHGVAGATFMAVLLSATTALGTAALPVSGRFAYWLSEMLLGATIIGGTLWLIRPIDRRHIYLRTALVVALATPLILVMVWLTTEPVKGHALEFGRIPSYLPGVLPIVGFNAFMQIIFGRKHLAEQASCAGGSEFTVESMHSIYAIEAHAHYVVFHTSQGQRRELMRLYDAINRVSIDGIQVHRSWWVAYQAIRRADFAARKLHLVNDQSVPISRSRLTAVRQTIERVPYNDLGLNTPIDTEGMTCGTKT